MSPEEKAVINGRTSALPCEQGHIPDGTWNQTFGAGMTKRELMATIIMSGSANTPLIEQRVTNAVQAADALLLALEQVV